jgi:hypothetical protein
MIVASIPLNAALLEATVHHMSKGLLIMSVGVRQKR